LVDFKEFGKVFVKHDLENDLSRHKIYTERDLDVPFSFPNTSFFQEKIAVFSHLGRASSGKNLSGP
jgi:tRNA/tmRNA/rRNA uracil-C5-methylase (TrmA/RlmC/RlmD family)